MGIELTNDGQHHCVKNQKSSFSNEQWSMANDQRFYGRIVLTLIYEKYEIPILKYWGIRELARFFKYEHYEQISKEQCRKILLQLSTNGRTLTLDHFFSLLHMPRFNMANPIHQSECHSMNKSLINYYVATCPILSLKSNDQIESNILAKYDCLLYKCRCFQLKLDWNKNQIGVLVNRSNLEMIGVSLKTLLKHMVDYGFNENPWPILLVLDCKNLILSNRMNELIQTLNNTLPTRRMFNESTTAQTMFGYKFCFVKNSNQITWPSLQSLCRKFIVIIKHSDSMSTVFMTVDNNNLDWNNTNAQQHHDNQSNTVRLANEQYCVLSLDSKRIIDSIERDKDGYSDDSLSTLTSKAFTWTNQQSSSCRSIDLIRMGIQCIPYKTDVDDDDVDTQVARSFFDSMNGSCGYILKPNSLRHGQMYSIGVSEDRSLPGEPSTGPTRFILTIYCIEDLMQFDSFINPMRCQVVVQIMGHHEDSFRYVTPTCSTQGQIPFWNEQIRPVIRLPNFTFIRFEVYNCYRLVAHRTLPFKAMMRGTRFITLNGIDGNNNGKLFVHSNFKKIASCWSPDFHANGQQQHHHPKQKHFIDCSDIAFIDEDNDDYDQD